MTQAGRRRKRHTFSTIMLLIACAVFCFALFKLVAGEMEY